MLAAKASKHLGLERASRRFPARSPGPISIPGRSAPPGLIETAFDELARRWKPILDAFDEAGVDVAYETPPRRRPLRRRDLRDASSTALKGHKRCAINYDPSHFVLQQLDYLEFIDIYHERIKAFHVKDAEFNPNGRQGVYSGYQPWIDRAGRFRSLGDGQVDFTGIFSKLAQYGYSTLGGARMGMLPQASGGRRARGRDFIQRHIIRVTEKAFDDFAGGATDEKQIERALGLG